MKAKIGRGGYLGVPLLFEIMLAIPAVAMFATQKMPFGRYMYAIGNNNVAAKMLGVRVDRVRVLIFGAAGVLAALAGMLMVARRGSAQSSIGDSWVLAPIAAAVIGGVPTTGGLGNPLGAILGAAIIGMIENIIVLAGISPYWQPVVRGAICDCDRLRLHRPPLSTQRRRALNARFLQGVLPTHQSRRAASTSPLQSAALRLWPHAKLREDYP